MFMFFNLVALATYYHLGSHGAKVVVAITAVKHLNDMAANAAISGLCKASDYLSQFDFVAPDAPLYPPCDLTGMNILVHDVHFEGNLALPSLLQRKRDSEAIKLEGGLSGL